MAKDPELASHQEWLGYLQPMGLVVSPPALAAAGAYANKNIIPDHARFLDCVEEITIDGETDTRPSIPRFARFATHVLGWEPADLFGSDEGGPLPNSLEVTLPEYNETLRPTFAVREFTNLAGADARWLLLIQKVKAGISLDDVAETDDHRWQASPQARFERLLRGTQVPIGLISNGVSLRLAYAPPGETSGHLTFPVKAMTEVSGRSIFAALHMLLSAERLFSLPDKQRLPAILAESRKYQNLVSTKLAEQVLAALYELLRGFQAADDQRHGELLRDVLAHDPNQVYAGLLRVLLRLVFILFAEDRSLLSNDEVYQKYYSVIGLFDRLRAEAGRHFDTMDHRFGAWSQLLTLFRLIFDGGRHGGLKLLPRKGYLFDPDRYPFLEGRSSVGRAPHSEARPTGTIEALDGPRDLEHAVRPSVPRISDGIVFRVLQNLLILDGERLSYRTLDVEQIGSVYETIMGFNLEVAKGRSIAIKPTKPHGAPTTINLEELLAARPADRAKWLKEQTDQTVTGQAASALKDALTPEDAVVALEKKLARAATPTIIPPGAMVLQPSDERRRSGSHYTPRSLTQPIVATTLRPIIERLGPNPSPDQILDLKVCDPAMGSGAFLVEACRALGEHLVRSWHAHDCVPAIPPDEDEILHARRVVAQRCLYGVDKNPMAVDLAKLSLWLATLAKDDPFTFLDHALRCGDSLVGLSRKQIEGFHWKPDTQRDFARGVIEGKIKRAVEGRRKIQNASDFEPYMKLDQELALVEEALKAPRFYGDLVVSAFFAGSNDKQRKARLDELTGTLAAHLAKPDFLTLYPALESARHGLRSGEKAIAPFHWEIEFPEVFDRENPGFDGFVGNPPFAGKNNLIGGNRESYLDWLKSLHDESHGNADLVAHFFRRSFDLLCGNGAFGLIATNTIGQGDTRSTGLRWICNHGGTIYAATRRKKWPGLAAVIVSVVHVGRVAPANARPTETARGPAERGLVGLTTSSTAFDPPFRLDDRFVPLITAYLFHAGGHDDPARLRANEGKSFVGSYVLGMGFTFDDSDKNGVANPLSLMHELIAKDPRNAERIFPYIGGEEVNDSPTHAHHRYVINFGEMTEEEARRWPDLMRIVEMKVRPDRARLGGNRDAEIRKKRWWLWGRYTPALFDAIRSLERVLVCGQTSKYRTMLFLKNGYVYDQKLIVFPLDSLPVLAVMQSRAHEQWALFFGSSMKDDPVYTPSDCFDTFAFPPNFETAPTLESTGQAYYEFRAALMIKNNEGLTKTYNRFHDPDERSPEILELRELHAAMDRAVLNSLAESRDAPGHATSVRA
jgi:hypothetical protein